MRWQPTSFRAGPKGMVPCAVLILAFLAVFVSRARGLKDATTPSAPGRLEQPASAEEWVRRGDLALRGRRLGRAESAFLQALRLDPGQAPAHLGLAWIHTSQMRRPEAISEYSAADELRPLDSGQVLVWTQVRCGMWDPDKVTGPLRDCLSNDPDDRWTRVALAEGLRWGGKPREAEDVLGPLGDAVPEARVIRAWLAIDREGLQA